METINLFGTECVLQFGRYPNNTVAIQAYRKCDRELCYVPTVNYECLFQGYDYTKTFSFPLVIIKNYSENEGIYQQLIAQNVIISGLYLSGSCGTVQAAMLTEKWQNIARKQIEISLNEALDCAVLNIDLNRHYLPSIKSLYHFALSELGWSEAKADEFSKKAFSEFHDVGIKQKGRFYLWFFINNILSDQCGCISINEAIDNSRANLKKKNTGQLEQIVNEYARLELNLNERKGKSFVQKVVKAISQHSDHFKIPNRKRFLLWYAINYLFRKEVNR